MKIAMLYASWEKFGEKWSTPIGIKNELISRGHTVNHYNLYHDDGILFKNNTRHYSNQGINLLYHEYQNNIFVPDAIIVMDYGPWDAIQFDKKYFPGIKLIKEAGDEPQAHAQHWSAASRVDHILSPDIRCTNRYNAAGYNAIFWTHFADTRIFYPKQDINEIFDCVTTCGPRGNGLTDKIKKALDYQFNNERYFYGEDHANRLNMGKIVFQCSQHKEITRRIFEGMACGKMVITDRLPKETGIEDLFIDGQDIVYYDDADDAIDKIKYYASNDEERKKIALNGFNKVMQNHTQIQRCNVIENLLK